MSNSAAAALLPGLILVVALLWLIINGLVSSADRARARRALEFARHGDLTAVEEHPRLIDLDTGHEYEWVTDTENPDGSGYANVLDHDFAWPRKDLERVAPLVELRSLDPSQIEQLRRQLDQ